jgi:hypothetical protein
LVERFGERLCDILGRSLAKGVTRGLGERFVARLIEILSKRICEGLGGFVTECLKRQNLDETLVGKGRDY